LPPFRTYTIAADRDARAEVRRDIHLGSARYEGRLRLLGPDACRPTEHEHRPHVDIQADVVSRCADHDGVAVDVDARSEERARDVDLVDVAGQDRGVDPSALASHEHESRSLVLAIGRNGPDVVEGSADHDGIAVDRDTVAKLGFRLG
jgi:hypothetical protein